jgi:hypothetical protein
MRLALAGRTSPSLNTSLANPVEGRLVTLFGFAGTAHRGGNGLTCGCAAGPLHPAAHRPPCCTPSTHRWQASGDLGDSWDGGIGKSILQ